IGETEDKKDADPADTAKDNQKGDSVNTGDETPIILYVGLLAASVLVILMVLIGIYRRRRA
ncbi:MAG: LPXTG cell wall anchor domain-containing protein, partial [Lachnospiraceae bacterium]|nr:LPXTG cell wall anchor domain-containing protein [Lachnospiraceae bacterium]